MSAKCFCMFPCWHASCAHPIHSCAHPIQHGVQLCQCAVSMHSSGLDAGACKASRSAICQTRPPPCEAAQEPEDLALLVVLRLALHDRDRSDAAARPRRPAGQGGRGERGRMARAAGAAAQGGGAAGHRACARHLPGACTTSLHSVAARKGSIGQHQLCSLRDGACSRFEAEALGKHACLPRVATGEPSMHMTCVTIKPKRC